MIERATRLPLKTLWLVALCLVSAPCIGLELDSTQVKWGHLLFKASSLLGSATARIELTRVEAEELTQSLVSQAQGQPAAPANAPALLLSADIKTNPLIGSKKLLRFHVWFDPHSAAALQRTRLKLGGNPSHNIYRFSPHGVRHRRAAPQSKNDARMPADDWPITKDKFFTYEPDSVGCSIVSDPAVLVYILSAASGWRERGPLDVCVFNKQAIYHVQLKLAATERLKINYTETAQGAQTNVNGEVSALKVLVTARPIMTVSGDAKPFELLELRGNIEIFLDEASLLPILIRGEAGGIGKDELSLIDVSWKR